MSNENKKGTGAQKPAAAAAPASAVDETLIIPAIDPRLVEGWERIGTSAVGFARTDQGDQILGTILGMHPKLECVLLELNHPAVVHDGKPDDERKFWVAKKGEVVNVNIHYETSPVLLEPDMISRQIFITVGDEQKIKGGRTLKHFDVRVPPGTPKPGLATRGTKSPDGAPALPAPNGSNRVPADDRSAAMQERFGG